MKNKDISHKISIIMSMYDGDKIDFINETLESIQSQTFKDFECVIVLDGIKNTKFKSNIKQSLKKFNFSYKLIENPVNKGLAYCMNLAIDNSNGKYIARMDADDIMDNKRLEIQNNFLDNNPSIDVVGSYIIEFNEEKKEQLVTYPLTHDEMKASFGKRNPLAHSSVLFRETYFDKAGKYPLNTDKDEDTVLWLNGFLNNCKFGNIGMPLTRFRVSYNFYRRRGGFGKAYNDLKNRVLVINKLDLPKFNYFYAFGRFIIQIIPSPMLKKISYKYLR